MFRNEVSPMYPKLSCRVHQVVLQRLARPEHRLTPSLRRASAAVDAAGRSLERWVRRLELEVSGDFPRYPGDTHYGEFLGFIIHKYPLYIGLFPNSRYVAKKKKNKALCGLTIIVGILGYTVRGTSNCPLNLPVLPLTGWCWPWWANGLLRWQFSIGNNEQMSNQLRVQY